MFGIGQLADSLRIATVVVPVGLYFLILGLLNTRSHPQLLTGRWDFALLAAALGPVLAQPVFAVVGTSPAALAGAAAALAVPALLLAPRGRTWVIYNLPFHLAGPVVRDALASLHLPARPADGGFHLGGEQFVAVEGFPLLRNVTVRLVGGDARLARDLHAALADRLGRIEGEATPAAVALMLVATAMMVAPLALVARRVPEIVRLLTDLLP